MDPVLITALIFAGLGMLGNGIDSVITTNDARDKAKADRDYITNEYNLNKKDAEDSFNKAKDEAEKNAAKMNQSADLTDIAQNIGEKSLSNDINTAIDNLFLSQAGDAYNWNMQAMQNGASAGSSYAALAGSGVRSGNSLSNAVELQSATNAALLQFSQDTKRRSDNNNLGSVLNQLAGNEFNIMQNRIGADVQRQDALDLVNSYIEGGSNYKLYQNQIDKMDLAYKYNLKNINDVIDKNSWKKGDAWLRLGTSLITGGISGFETGYSLYDTAFKAANYKTT
ncbi:MAG: hypothetical protein J6S85_01740 [Methanobrevibacter sp.]|nr:hypothetical protein [Methanobrevibacter sp.]MBO7712257.1 hypothetical protein [Methanobrevibacter sp.]